MEFCFERETGRTVKADHAVERDLPFSAVAALLFDGSGLGKE